MLFQTFVVVVVRPSNRLLVVLVEGVPDGGRLRGRRLLHRALRLLLQGYQDAI